MPIYGPASGNVDHLLGEPNGIAELGEGGIVPFDQLPDIVDYKGEYTEGTAYSKNDIVSVTYTRPDNSIQLGRSVYVAFRDTAAGEAPWDGDPAGWTQIGGVNLTVPSVKTWHGDISTPPPDPAEGDVGEEWELLCAYYNGAWSYSAFENEYGYGWLDTWSGVGYPGSFYVFDGELYKALDFTESTPDVDPEDWYQITGVESLPSDSVTAEPPHFLDLDGTPSFWGIPGDTLVQNSHGELVFTQGLGVHTAWLTFSATPASPSVNVRFESATAISTRQGTFDYHLDLRVVDHDLPSSPTDNRVIARCLLKIKDILVSRHGSNDTSGFQLISPGTLEIHTVAEKEDGPAILADMTHSVEISMDSSASVRDDLVNVPLLKVELHSPTFFGSLKNLSFLGNGQVVFTQSRTAGVFIYRQ